jgi:hypothetical protein
VGTGDKIFLLFPAEKTHLSLLKNYRSDLLVYYFVVSKKNEHPEVAIA